MTYQGDVFPTGPGHYKGVVRPRNRESLCKQYKFFTALATPEKMTRFQKERRFFSKDRPTF